MFKSVVVSEPIEVDARLQVLGLTTSLLSEAIQRGHLARMSCTANDPIGAAGYAGWSHTVRALRDLLVPLGWRRNEDEQLPLTINEANTVAIAVSHGDPATGVFGRGEPRTKYPKGPATAAFVEQNAAQLQLPLGGNLVQLRPARALTDRTTWLLLLHPTPEEVRAELSLPAFFSPGGHVLTWAQRIILAPLPVDPVPGLHDTDAETTPEIDISVSRRS